MSELDFDSAITGLVALLAVVAVVLLLSAPWWTVLVAAVLAVPPALLVSRRVRRTLRQRATTGPESLPGANGIVTARLEDPNSALPYVVRLGGELWTARSLEDLTVGDRVLVIDVEDNHLLVCRLPREIAGR
jgi:membrane protein implicated in regulation of membrane protease activity